MRVLILASFVLLLSSSSSFATGSLEQQMLRHKIQDRAFIKVFQTLSGNDFYKSYEPRIRLLGTLHFCKDKDSFTKLTEQNFTSASVEKHFNNNELFPDLTDEERIYHSAISMMYISGYTYGTLTAHTNSFKQASAEEIKRVCDQTKQPILKELEKASSPKTEKFQYFLDAVKPTFPGILSKHAEQTFNIVWLLMENQGDLVDQYVRFAKINDTVKRSIYDKHPEIDAKTLMQYETIATAFMAGMATGRVKHYIINTDDQQIISKITDTVADHVRKEMATSRNGFFLQ